MRTTLFALAGAALIALAGCGPAKAPSGYLSPDQRREVVSLIADELKAHPELVKAANDELARRDRMALRKVIESDRRDFAIGPADAKVTIVEYFDYRCPYCQQALPWALDTIKKYPKQVRFVFKEVPIHGAEAQEASAAALAAIKQGKYLQLHQALLTYRGDLGTPQIDEIARQNGVDVLKMRRDMQDGGIVSHIRDNFGTISSLEQFGTPTYLVNGEWVVGWNRPELERLLSEGLKS